MNEQTQNIFNQVQELSDTEKAELVEHILFDLEKPDESMDAIWKQEVIQRLKAYDEGQIRSIPLEEVLAKYKNKS